jgi:hypothetical protein
MRGGTMGGGILLLAAALAACGGSVEGAVVDQDDGAGGEAGAPTADVIYAPGWSDGPRVEPSGGAGGAS